MSNGRKKSRRWKKSIDEKNRLIDRLVTTNRDKRRVYYYFKDRYALYLLGRAAGRGSSVRSLKKSPFAPLINRPVVKSALATHGRPTVTRSDFESIWPADPLAYRITFDSWGQTSRLAWRKGWNQTSRGGKNLVAQLNFPVSHNRAYHTLVDTEDNRPFEYYGHPVSEQEQTLAWARIDIDPEEGVALIEEVQSDWLHDVFSILRGLNSCGHTGEARRRCRGAYLDDWGVGGDERRFRLYVERVFWPLACLWQETMLSAVIEYLAEELAITSIYFHTWETGRWVKGMDEDHPPPRSIYTELARKFCFGKTNEGPRLVEESLERRIGTRRKYLDLSFRRLDLP